MNDDELVRLCGALSVTEREGPVKTLDVGLKDKGEQRLSMCLVGKLLATKLVNRVAFIAVMTSIWRVTGGVEIEWVEGNIFAFHFKNLEDRKRIQTGGPWSFDRAIIVFDEPVGDGDIQELSFRRVEFWVQIHKVPLLCMTEDIRVFLGNMIGVVRDIDLEAGKERHDRFLRVRVVIDTAEPLKRSIRVDLLGSGKITTMLLRYERLLDYCFKCGRLGHSMRECTEEGEERDVTSEASLRLNVWLRMVSPPKRFHHRSSRDDTRPWNPGGNFRNRRMTDSWKGKNNGVDAMGSGDRWRNSDPSPFTKPAEETCVPSDRGKEPAIALNVVDNEDRPGIQGFGEVTGLGGEKYFESSQQQVVSSAFQSGPGNLGPTIVCDGPVQSACLVGPGATSFRFKAVGISGLPPGKRGLGKDGGIGGPVAHSPLGQAGAAKATHTSTNWKRIARGSKRRQEVSVTVSEQFRSSEIGEKSKVAALVNFQGTGKVRRREECVGDAIDGHPRKKFQGALPMETVSELQSVVPGAIGGGAEISGLEGSTLL